MSWSVLSTRASCVACEVATRVVRQPDQSQLLLRAVAIAAPQASSGDQTPPVRSVMGVVTELDAAQPR
jgi:hypothetical protein